jgi:hypothetical protein
MNVEKIVSELEGKETLLIFLRDNFPDVLEKYKVAMGTGHSNTDDSNHDHPDRNGGDT